MLNQVAPAGAQSLLKMGPFSGSSTYIIMSTNTRAAYEAAVFGFKGKIIQITETGDVEALIDDKQAVLISNGDELFSDAILLDEFLKDMTDKRHRRLVVVHRHGEYSMPISLVNRFIHIQVTDPISSDEIEFDLSPWPEVKAAIVRKANNEQGPNEKEVVDRLMVLTEMAWMRGEYGEERWRREIDKLRERGLSFREVQAVMRSKYPRWAEETFNLDDLFRQFPRMISRSNIEELTASYDDLKDQ